MDDETTMKPGMSRTVNAGETLIIEDSSGGRIAVEGRDSPSVMHFLNTFDEYQLARSQGVGDPIIGHLWTATQVAFRHLPNRVIRELDSTKKVPHLH